MGPLWSKIVDMRSLVRDGMGGEKKRLTFDFIPTLPAVTHNQRCLGKMDRFWGYVLLFRGSDRAPPMVQDG